tara:strand:+ start:140 stop:478 length:339 start_codon:yes stop_codon:yes gene_type:complete
MSEVQKFGIDLGRYQEIWNDKMDDAMSAFETEYIHNLADSILRIESPFYFDADGEISEHCYDDWADAHMDVVMELGKFIFGAFWYQKFCNPIQRREEQRIAKLKGDDDEHGK